MMMMVIAQCHDGMDDGDDNHDHDDSRDGHDDNDDDDDDDDADEWSITTSVAFQQFWTWHSCKFHGVSSTGCRLRMPMNFVVCLGPCADVGQARHRGHFPGHSCRAVPHWPMCFIISLMALTRDFPTRDPPAALEDCYVGLIFLAVVMTAVLMKLDIVMLVKVIQLDHEHDGNACSRMCWCHCDSRQSRMLFTDATNPTFQS